MAEHALRGVPKTPSRARAVALAAGALLGGRGGAGHGWGLSVSESGTIMVPMPSVVNTSSSSECGWRPSMTCACGTPRLDGAHAGLELGDHAGVDLGSSSSASDDRQAREQRVGVRPAGVEALDVGEDDQLVRAEGDRERRRRRCRR